MNRLRIEDAPSYADIDWTPFPGGELEAPRPRALCSGCKANRPVHSEAGSRRPALCFQCYRLEIERSRKLKAAADFHAASEARFQEALPFEPVNVSRLTQLKAEREAARVAAHAGNGSYVERRVRAQVQARHALARILSGVRARQVQSASAPASAPAPAPASASAGRVGAARSVRTAEFEFPEAWLPFVMSR